MQAVARETNRLSRTKDSPRIVEGKPLDLEQAWRPEQPVPRLDAADDLAGPHETAVVIAAERANAAQRDDRPFTRFHGLLRRERGSAGDVFAAEAPRENQPVQGMRVDVQRSAGARISPSAPNQQLGEDTAMRIHFQIAPIEHDPGARNAVTERADAIALKDADPREWAERGVLDSPTHQHTQWPDHLALRREPRRACRAAHPVEV